MLSTGNAAMPLSWLALRTVHNSRLSAPVFANRFLHHYLPPLPPQLPVLYLHLKLQGFAPHCLSPSAKRSVALLRCFQICLDTPLWKTHIKFLQRSSVMFSAPRMQCTICVALCIQFAMKVLGLIHVKVTVMMFRQSVGLTLLRPLTNTVTTCPWTSVSVASQGCPPPRPHSPPPLQPPPLSPQPSDQGKIAVRLIDTPAPQTVNVS